VTGSQHRPELKARKCTTAEEDANKVSPESTLPHSGKRYLFTLGWRQVSQLLGRRFKVFKNFGGPICIIGLPNHWD